MMLLLNSTESRGSSGQGGVCVGSFGERLRREREMRGITLEEIAAHAADCRKLIDAALGPPLPERIKARIAEDAGAEADERLLGS